MHPLPFVTFVVLVGAAYFLIGRKTTRRQGFAAIAALAAALPLIDGGMTAWREYGRHVEGTVAPGIVTGRLSTTGEGGSRTIGPSRRRSARRELPWLVTAEGFLYHDILARIVLTGSRDAWFIEYRVPCERASGCYRREEVGRDLWRSVRVGQAVNVRSARNQDDPGRLDGNPMWRASAARLAVAAVLLLVAAALSGRLDLITRRKYITARAVVMSVQPVPAGGKVHWRVGYAYFAPDGTAHQGSDEVYAASLKPGDECTAVYPPGRPDLGTLRT